MVTLKVFLLKIGKFAFAESQRHYKGHDKKCYKKKERKVRERSIKKWNGQAFMPSCLYVCAELLQSCPTLCNPMGCHIPGFSVQGIFQAIILEWVAMPSSKASSQPRDQIYVACMDRWILYHRITWYMLNQSYSSAKYPSERDGFLQFNV